MAVETKIGEDKMNEINKKIKNNNERKTCANPQCDNISGLYPKYSIEGVMHLDKEKAIRVCTTCISPFRSYIRKKEWDLWCIYSTDYSCPSDRHDVEWFGEEKQTLNPIKQQLKIWGLE